jgi:thiamine pyrophosphate-dependent acetolactate synthase large subunit-like protein
MGLGSLATIGVQKPANLSVVVIDNERYGETGMQATHTASGVDLAGMARAAGFASAVLVRDAAGVAGLRKLVHEASGPNFAQVKVAAEKIPLVLPPREGVLLKNRFRAALLGAGAALE